jgi:putative membrane protein
MRKPVLPWVLAGFAVLMQIAYPLTSGQTRTSLTIVTVVTFCLASTSHALLVRGLKWTAGYVAISVIGGWLIEYVGHTTDFPFGPYGYTTSLGWQLLGVPLVIPLAWSMMAYPALVVGQTMMRGRWGSILVAAVALASWDLGSSRVYASGHSRNSRRQLPRLVCSGFSHDDTAFTATPAR